MIRGKDCGLISLADEGYLQYMENIVRELCRNNGIDGLHLDYIRYNHLLYGWSTEDQVRYAAEGADISCLQGYMQRMFCNEHKEENLLFDAYRDGDQNVLALAQARRKDVVRFAKRLIDAAQSERRGLITSAA